MESTWKFRVGVIAMTLVVWLCEIFACSVFAADWTMLGRDGTRNGVSTELGAPNDWCIELRREGRLLQEARNIRWSAALGSQTHSSPVVSGGLVWIGTNSERTGVDRQSLHSVLKCFRVTDGKQVYEYDSPKLSDRIQDPGWTGLGSSPLIEGDRLWLTTNRSEVVCLDIGPLLREEGAPRELWKLDLIKRFQVFPHVPVMGPPRPCSIGPSWNGRIFVTTNNGVGQDHRTVTNPGAPSLVCLNKDTGEVFWTDNSPGTNILVSQFSSPTVAEIGGELQVIVPQSDGWVRAFDPMTGAKLWEFDINPKTSIFSLEGRSTRNYFMGNAVVYENRVYLASGEHAEMGEGVGRLVCIDPTKRGDLSSELAVDAAGRPLPRKRTQAVDPQAGERAIANPNSALVWEFDRGGKAFEDQMHRTLGSVVIAKDLVFAADSSGLVHCLDARTGQRHWSYDTLATIWTSPLIVDENVYVADEDGEVAIFRLSADPKVAMRNLNGGYQPWRTVAMQQPIYSSPIFANGVLYLATRTTLFAIASDKDQPTFNVPGGDWPQWRGPNRDNVSLEKGLLKSWPEAGPPLVWQLEGLGDGIASVSISEGRIFTVGYLDGSELALALDQKSGELLWSTRIGPAVAENSRMRWLSQRSPTIDSEQAYFMTASGDLVCLAARDGRELWRKNYVRDFGGKKGWWGFCDYPLIDSDYVICTPGGADATIVALDKATGTLIWKSPIPEAGNAAYAAMVVSSARGVRQYVALLEKGLVGIAADNGSLLWRYDRIANDQGSLTPITLGDLVLCASGRREAGIALLKISAAGKNLQVTEQYFQKLPLNHFQDSLLVLDGHLYGTTRIGPVCLELATGKLVWAAEAESSRSTMTALTAADGHLYVRLSNGLMKIVEANPEGFVVKGSFSIPDSLPSFGVTNPVVAGGRLYLRDNQRLFCYDVRDRNVKEPQTVARKIKLDVPKSPPAGTESDTSKARTLRSVFVPTPQDVVDKMLELAEVKTTDVVYDLGSGDGRIVITAAKQFGCRAVGYELDKQLVEASRTKADAAGVEPLVAFENQDLFSADLGQANVITLYLLPQQLEKLLPQLQRLKPGVRIVSHYFPLAGISPDKTVKIQSSEDGNEHTIYLWTVPLKKSGEGSGKREG